MTRGARRAAALLAAASVVSAAAGEASAAQWAVAPIAGGLRIDRSMADYRWDLGPVGLVGLAGHVGGDRVRGGIRVWRAETSQGTGIAGEDFAPAVGLTSLEGTLRVGVARALGLDLAALASAGRMRIGFDPDRAVVELPGGDGIEVRYEAVETWVGGAGVEMSRRIARRVEAGAAIERLAWRMDAAHRDGDAVREERIGTGAWALRVALSLGVGGGPEKETR